MKPKKKCDMCEDKPATDRVVIWSNYGTDRQETRVDLMVCPQCREEIEKVAD